LVGTTDTDYTGDLDRITTTKEDARYLLAEVRHFYPNLPWEPIHFTWAGVRSLMHIEGVPESDVTRKHLLYDHRKRDGIPGLLSIIGGKLTAHRWIAEDTVDTVCRILGITVKSITADLPLPGGMISNLARYVTANSEGQARRLGIDPAPIEHLIRTYGSRYARVLTIAEHDRSLLARVSPDHPDILAQAIYAVRHEGARTLSDVLLRRLTVGMSAGRGRDGAEQVAALLAPLLDWHKARIHTELAALDEQLALGASPIGIAAEEIGALP
jgi:glycerol-3-phosphate dehydrogenase